MTIMFLMLVHLHGGGLNVVRVDNVFDCLARKEFEERFDPRSRVVCAWTRWHV